MNFTNRTAAANGLGSNTINSVFFDGSTIYAGTSSGLGISTDGGLSFTNYTPANGLGNNSTTSVFFDGSNIYAGTSGGLSIAAVPEPSTMALAGIACVGYLLMRYRQKRTKG